MENVLRPRGLNNTQSENSNQKGIQTTNNLKQTAPLKVPLGSKKISDEKENSSKLPSKVRNVFQDLSHNPIAQPKQTNLTKRTSKLTFTLFEDSDEIEYVHKSKEKKKDDVSFVYRDENDNLVETKLQFEDHLDLITKPNFPTGIPKSSMNKRKKLLENIENDLTKLM